MSKGDNCYYCKEPTDHDHCIIIGNLDLRDAHVKCHSDAVGGKQTIFGKPDRRRKEYRDKDKSEPVTLKEIFPSVH